MIQENLYKVEYSKKNKSRGKRILHVFSESFEDVLTRYMYPNLYEKVFGNPMHWEAYDESGVKCLKSNSLRHEYQISYKDYNDSLVVVYYLEIELLNS